MMSAAVAYAAREPRSSGFHRANSVTVPFGAFDPEQLNRLTRDRLGLGALGGGVGSGLVGVPRVGAEPVAAGDELFSGGRYEGLLQFRGGKRWFHAWDPRAERS